MLTLVTFIFFVSFLMSATCIRFLLVRPLEIFQPTSNQLHHTHSGIIPRIGGVGIFISYLCIFLGVVFWFSFDSNIVQTHFAVFLGALLAFGLGLVDDIFSLSARFKLFFQISGSTLISL